MKLNVLRWENGGVFLSILEVMISGVIICQGILNIPVYERSGFQWYSRGS